MAVRLSKFEVRAQARMFEVRAQARMLEVRAQARMLLGGNGTQMTLIVRIFSDLINIFLISGNDENQRHQRAILA